MQPGTCLALRATFIFPLVFTPGATVLVGPPILPNAHQGSPLSHPGCARAGHNYPTGATYRENCNLW